MYVWERSVGRCLSIVQLSRHHPVVGRSLIHRPDPLTWPRATISVTLGALLSRLVRPIRERTWWYSREWERSVGRCLSIVQLSRRHPVVGQSLIHRSDPLTWPRATISVTLGALLSRLVRPIRERIWWYSREWERSVGRCLSIVKLPRRHPVVGRSLIHRSDPLTWPRATISVTLGALLSRLVRPIRERTWWYVRVGAVGWPVFEHCAVVLTPPGGGTITHSPIRPAHLAPCHDIRYSRRPTTYHLPTMREV